MNNNRGVQRVEVTGYARACERAKMRRTVPTCSKVEGRNEREVLMVQGATVPVIEMRGKHVELAACGCCAGQ